MCVAVCVCVCVCVCVWKGGEILLPWPQDAQDRAGQDRTGSKRSSRKHNNMQCTMDGTNYRKKESGVGGLRGGPMEV